MDVPIPATLKDLEGSASLATISDALGPGYAYMYLRLGLGEGEATDWQAGVDASGDMFWGYSYLERDEKSCCYGDD
jgi:hypothetical protein